MGFEVLTTKISVFLDVITFHSDDGGSSFLQMTNYPFEIATDHMGPLLINMTYLSRRRVGGVAQWLRCCATNRKVAGSIPDGVIGIFH